MPRRKPASGKEHRAELQRKRAVKRGDLPPPAAASPNDKPRQPAHRPEATISTRALESSFTRVSRDYLAHTRLLAATVRLARPVPGPTAATARLLSAAAGPLAGTPELTCARRPKWRYDTPKAALEKNEEAAFATWLAQTDAALRPRPAAGGDRDSEPGTPSPSPSPSPSPAPAPAYFERNVEVWRQLWRVVEIAQILLVLLDSRCPPVHYPPSLAAYIHALRPPRKLILVLTKIDIAGKPRADRWQAWLLARFPGVRVVQVDAYAPADDADAPHARTGPSVRRPAAPHLPGGLRATLVAALKDAHAELLQPPDRLRAPEHAAKLRDWRPPVAADVDWDAVLRATGTQPSAAVPVPGPGPGPAAATAPSPEGVPRPVDAFLTVGLIGQPNVGKSSLLNALFGTHKVKASRTPGKTKHFQTLFWTPHVRLVDCPGLVMPHRAPMELQALAGVLSIAQIPSTASCVHFAAGLMPLERVFGLVHPGAAAAGGSAGSEDRRTWRGGQRPSALPPLPDSAGPIEPPEPAWTAMDIMTAYALKKGWVTAKAGRPDVHRAGNAIMRALAESKVRWAFDPPVPDGQPDTPPSSAATADGIWIRNPDGPEIGHASDSSADESWDTPKHPRAHSQGDVEESDDSEWESESDDVDAHVAGIGRFGALSIAEDGLDDAEDDEEDEAEEDSHEHT